MLNRYIVRLAAPSFIGALALVGCDQFVAGPAALVREGSAKACAHPVTLAQVKQVATFADQREAPADEAAAIQFRLVDPMMLTTEPGVSVTCEIGIEASYDQNTHRQRFIFLVLPIADSAEIRIRWHEGGGNFPGAAYSAARYDWNLARQEGRTAGMQGANGSAPQDAPPSQADATSLAPATPGDLETAEILFESGPTKIVYDNRNSQTLCLNCGATQRHALHVGLGPGFVKGSHDGWVLLTENTGNSVPGGTTYAIDVRSGRAVDLKSTSSAAPEFQFVEVDGAPHVQVTESEQIWTIALRR